MPSSKWVDVKEEGTGTRPDYLVNREELKNEGPFDENDCTKNEK